MFAFYLHFDDLKIIISLSTSMVNYCIFNNYSFNIQWIWFFFNVNHKEYDLDLGNNHYLHVHLLYLICSFFLRRLYIQEDFMQCRWFLSVDHRENVNFKYEWYQQILGNFLKLWKSAMNDHHKDNSWLIFLILDWMTRKYFFYKDIFISWLFIW